jgi:hypothetical protein
VGGYGYHRFLIRADYAELALEACHFVRFSPGGAPDTEAVTVREAEAFACRVLDGRDGLCRDSCAVFRGDQLAAFVAALVEQEAAEAG